MNITRLLPFALLAASLPAQIFVDIPYQVRYLSNLDLGDSSINITNSGAIGAGLGSGTTAAVTGAICVNAYVFSPDEQMIACCSCPVTPNGLVSLSARQDLINNTLTPAVPTSIMVKLVATVPVAQSCATSSSTPFPTLFGVPVLPNGMMAWATTVHASSTPGAPPVQTETAFKPATLSPSEATRLTSLCSFLNANGSGFGICRSCRLGGLGASRL